MAVGGDQHRQTSGMISMRELLDQIDTNKKHFMRSSRSVPELPSTLASRSPLALSLPTSLPPVRELDNDPDTFMLFCLPVLTLQALGRRTRSCINFLLWTRPPMPCVGTTCGPIHHVRSCEFHPLSGALPYQMPIRRSVSLPSVAILRSRSTPENLSSSSSFSGPSSPTSSPASPSTGAGLGYHMHT